MCIFAEARAFIFGSLSLFSELRLNQLPQTRDLFFRIVFPLIETSRQCDTKQSTVSLCFHLIFCSLFMHRHKTEPLFSIALSPTRWSKEKLHWNHTLTALVTGEQKKMQYYKIANKLNNLIMLHPKIHV